jgi:hypothetical protein
LVRPSGIPVSDQSILRGLKRLSALRAKPFAGAGREGAPHERAYVRAAVFSDADAEEGQFDAIGAEAALPEKIQSF